MTPQRQKKHANELKVLPKTVRIAIKQDFCPEFIPLIMLYGTLKKTKQILLIQILFRFRLLLRIY